MKGKRHLSLPHSKALRADFGRLVDALSALIGVGKAFRPPLPPNRTCGSPAYGSPVSGFTFARIERLRIGPNASY